MASKRLGSDFSRSTFDTESSFSEEKPGWFRVNWSDIRHPQLNGYEIHLDHKVVGRSRFPSYLVGVPITTLLEKKGEELSLEVFCIYLNGEEQEKLSAPGKC